ncbi:hypothetical protein, conserved [Eimeria tenella]|uniref:Uncharacterized protein n=1 Tax=Eimeria tenella TaxID=5802 RepID=U6KNN9_EIMTE|nr:hypothetical protein, conserved [Eimeria tenella]CDJ39737.1 hypothetical protein, conserved [Eimeria tenella]|eukprot:XP_013230490.1 hypothetical protein, conserved [Eimeria tenella]
MLAYGASPAETIQVMAGMDPRDYDLRHGRLPKCQESAA